MSSSPSKHRLDWPTIRACLILALLFALVWAVGSWSGGVPRF